MSPIDLSSISDTFLRVGHFIALCIAFLEYPVFLDLFPELILGLVTVGFLNVCTVAFPASSSDWIGFSIYWRKDQFGQTAPKQDIKMRKMSFCHVKKLKHIKRNMKRKTMT
jgi:hypothetical protein